jgi:hypothetical protein
LRVYAGCTSKKWSIRAIRRSVSPATMPRAASHRKGDDVYQRQMVLYTRGRSLSCWRARRFLGRAGYSFEVVDATADPGAMAELSEVVYREVTPPYVFVENRPLGGMGTVRALAGSGQFEHLLRDELWAAPPSTEALCKGVPRRSDTAS